MMKARKNVRKAAAAARRKKTIAHLPKESRTAVGKQDAKVASSKRSRSNGLGTLAGTWSTREFDEFESAVDEVAETNDEDVWR